MEIAVIVAAGKGQRLSELLGMKKQFYPLYDNKEMFLLSIYPFLNSGFDNIFLIVPLEDEEKAEEILKRENLLSKVFVVKGGESREESVRNALYSIKDKYSKEELDSSYIYIHDGDRPLVSTGLIKRERKELLTHDSVIPYFKVDESLFNIKENKYVNREDYKRIQTPQCFKWNVIYDSFMNIKGKEKEFSDEGGIVEHSSYKVFFLEGEERNIKISDENSLVLGLYYLRNSKDGK